MRPKNLPLCFATALLLTITTQIKAQTNKGYAITGETKGHVAWTVIREIDLSTGVEIRKIYAPSDKPSLVEAQGGRHLQQLDPTAELTNEVTVTGKNGIQNTTVTFSDGRHSEIVTAPTETLVAASAYDGKSNRLFFTPMHSNELRFFDLNKGTNTVYYVRDVALKTFPERNGEADVITRMCFGSDGYGYALTNDFSHLIRFSSGNKISITDLGAVQDGKNNRDISIRNKCTSWGGDVIADAYGNLYVISMQGNIFKINPQRMVADLIGTVKNIPKDYTINGAAVDEEGKIIVSCASKTDHYYSFDLTTLEASPLARQKQEVFNASDMASCHTVYENLAKNAAVTPTVKNSRISFYPNPVVNKNINIVFGDLANGNHNVQLVDAAGQVILNKTININGKTTSQLALSNAVKNGLYVIKINDGKGQEQYSGKVIVQH